jgi:hypothetical protein
MTSFSVKLKTMLSQAKCIGKRCTKSNNFSQMECKFRLLYYEKFEIDLIN